MESHSETPCGHPGSAIRKNCGFFLPSVAHFISSVTVSAGSAPGHLGGKCVCHGNITEESGLEWNGERTQNLHELEHEETDPPKLERNMGDADIAKE